VAIDESNVTYGDYTGRVQFTITGDTGSVTYGDLEVFAVNGIAYIDLTSTDNTGIISITAKTLDLSEYSFIDVSTFSPTTVQVKAVDIELVDGSIEYWGSKEIVLFNINIIGPEPNLQSMIIEWGYYDSKLSKIEIKNPYTAVDYYPIIDVSNEDTPYNQNNINANLLPGESTIRLTFSKNMINRSLAVTFNTKFGTYEYTEKITVEE